MPKLNPAQDWFKKKSWKPYDFQIETWKAVVSGKSGLLNAPTGSGKTYAMWLGCIINALNSAKKNTGLQIIWVTPLKALAKDISHAMQEACDGMELDWQVALRTGDTSQKKEPHRKRKCLRL